MASMKPLLRPQHLRGVFSTSTTSLSIPQVCLLQSSIRSTTRAASTSTTSAPKPPQIPPPDAPGARRGDLPDGDRAGPEAARGQDPGLGEPVHADVGAAAGAGRGAAAVAQVPHPVAAGGSGRGEYGIGGDLRHVEDGVAHLRVLEAANGADVTQTPRKFVVNVPADRSLKECDPAELSRVQGYHVKGAKKIVGPYALPIKGAEGARITVTEGMWEDRRGWKIDGGERRRTEIRYKRRITERREARERAEL
ncbi:hypothetical protein CIB48_g515 [Xylaria polymorpha]|nr:hypothetical protein CIB48_g515 [Xylaria polymorpha]